MEFTWVLFSFTFRNRTVFSIIFAATKDFSYPITSPSVVNLPHRYHSHVSPTSPSGPPDTTWMSVASENGVSERNRGWMEGWPCTGESFSEFNRQSRKVQHSPFFPALGTKPPGEEGHGHFFPTVHITYASLRSWPMERSETGMIWAGIMTRRVRRREKRLRKWLYEPSLVIICARLLPLLSIRSTPLLPFPFRSGSRWNGRRREQRGKWKGKLWDQYCRFFVSHVIYRWWILVPSLS